MFGFHGVDFMEIDSLLTDEEKLVPQTVRKFCQHHRRGAPEGRQFSPPAPPGLRAPAGQPSCRYVTIAKGRFGTASPRKR